MTTPHDTTSIGVQIDQTLDKLQHDLTTFALVLLVMTAIGFVIMAFALRANSQD